MGMPYLHEMPLKWQFRLDSNRVCVWVWVGGWVVFLMLHSPRRLDHITTAFGRDTSANMAECIVLLVLDCHFSNAYAM